MMNNPNPLQRAEVSYRLRRIFEVCPALQNLPTPGNDVEVYEILGTGAYGVVQRVKIKSLGNVEAAVKIVSIKDNEATETWQEVEIMRECCHKNIVKLYKTYMEGVNLWIAMEYCNGTSLDYLYRDYPMHFSEDAISCILFEAMKGLEYFHNTFHIHRDIKAANLLVTNDGQVKLADFGISAKLSSQEQNARSFLGTPLWMAPEVIRSQFEPNNSYSAKADIWSIGITAIEVAEKRPPFSKMHPLFAMQTIFKGDKPIGLKKPHKRSDQFIDFISCCLIRDPELRPSASQVLDHPFLKQAIKLARNILIAELVHRVKTYSFSPEVGPQYESTIVDNEFAGSQFRAPPTAETVAITIKSSDSTPSLPVSTAMAVTASKQQQHCKVLVSRIGSENQELRTSRSSKLRHIFMGETHDFCVTFHYAPFMSAAANPQSQHLRSYAKEIELDMTVEENVHCGAFIGTNLLVGTDAGLLVADLEAKPMVPVLCIPGVRFRQIEVLHDYSVVMALSGRKDHVRQYPLVGIKKIIQHALQMKESFRHASATQNSNEINTGTTEATLRCLDEAANSFIKIRGTCNSSSFTVSRTAGSIFLLSQLGTKMTLFEWAKAPYGKFMKVRSIWVPEKPNFFSIINDGYYAYKIWIGYASEANAVDVEDAMVQDIDIHENFKSTSQYGASATTSNQQSSSAAGASAVSHQPDLSATTSTSFTGRVSNFFATFFESQKRPMWRGFVQMEIEGEEYSKACKTFGPAAKNFTDSQECSDAVPPNLAAAISPYAYAKQDLTPVEVNFLATYGNVTCVTDDNAVPKPDSHRIVWKTEPAAVFSLSQKRVAGLFNSCIEIHDPYSGKHLGNVVLPFKSGGLSLFSTISASFRNSNLSASFAQRNARQDSGNNVAGEPFSEDNSLGTSSGVTKLFSKCEKEGLVLVGQRLAHRTYRLAVANLNSLNF